MGESIDIGDPEEDIDTRVKEMKALNEKLKYVLDPHRPSAELIVKEGNICLTREDFWSLGLNQCMDSNGKDIHVVDMYVVPTWKTKNVDPLVGFPRILRGNEPSKWLDRFQEKSSFRVPVYLESDEQQDALFSYLERFLRTVQTAFPIRDRVQFILDVLFPEVRPLGWPVV
ncbi:MUM1 protein, partial [Polypterus senegalus]